MQNIIRHCILLIVACGWSYALLFDDRAWFSGRLRSNEEVLALKVLLWGVYLLFMWVYALFIAQTYFATRGSLVRERFRFPLSNGISHDIATLSGSGLAFIELIVHPLDKSIALSNDAVVTISLKTGTKLKERRGAWPSLNETFESDFTILFRNSWERDIVVTVQYCDEKPIVCDLEINCYSNANSPVKIVKKTIEVSSAIKPPLRDNIGIKLGPSKLTRRFQAFLVLATPILTYFCFRQTIMWLPLSLISYLLMRMLVFRFSRRSSLVPTRKVDP